MESIVAARGTGTSTRPKPGTGDGIAMSKVPETVLVFWIIKILATTLGETGGDAVSMSMGLGYAVGTGIFMLLFLGAVAAQGVATGFRPFVYWTAIVASTTVGTTLADLVDRSLDIGYASGVLILVALMAGSFGAWRRSTGSVDPAATNNTPAEFFYWLTIMLSQTLGTALGDWVADSAGLGYAGGTMLFAGLLLAVAAAHAWSRWSRVALFWAAFILTRPLGAVVGDFLDKPVVSGGLELSRYAASGTLLVAIVLLVLLFPQRAAVRAH